MNDMVCPNCGEAVNDGVSTCPACGHLFVGRPCDRHPDREAQGACVICDRALCQECDQRQRVHHVCAEHASVPLIEGWAQVYLAVDDIEAELIRDNLEAEGIEAQVFSQKDHFSFAVDLGELSRVRVLVRASDYVQAARLMAEHKDSHGEVVFACPACGEAYDPGELRCSSCGAVLPTQVGNSPA